MTLMLALSISPTSILEILYLKWKPLPYPTVSLDEVEGAIFITGSSSGIGKDAAFHLAETGYHVFASVRKESDIRRLEKEYLERLSKDRHQYKNNLHPVICDVTNADTIASAKQAVATWLGQKGDKKDRVLVGIVNNAGVSSELEPMESLTPESFNMVMDTNLKGSLQVYQAFLPLLREYGHGRIVNVGSIAGLASRPFRGGYTVSKFALEGFSDTIRQELYYEGISVSMVNPGFIRTGIFDKHQATTDAKYGVDNPREELSALQRSMLQSYLDFVENMLKQAGSVNETSAAIAHALTSPSPKTRYYPGSLGVAGLPAWAFAKIKSVAPDRILDYTILKNIADKKEDGN